MAQIDNLAQIGGGGDPDPETCYVSLVDRDFFVSGAMPGIAVYDADSLRIAGTREFDFPFF